jgi:hypothetical protein
MNDVHDANADLLADQFAGNPELVAPISEEFAAASDEGYAEFSDPGTEDEATGFPEPTTPAAPDSAAEAEVPQQLTEAQQTNLDALENVLRRGGPSPLLASGGRGQYIHHDEDTDTDTEAEAGADDATPTEDVLETGSEPWWKFGWFHWDRRSHRVGALAAAAVIVVSATLLWPSGNSNPPAPNPSASFSVPTVTETAHPAPGPAGSPGADGPIKIKRADNRCTAGSTDPMQALDNDVNTAWMCVPAYLPKPPAAGQTIAAATVLRVEFEKYYVVTGLCIVPGWNRINPDKSDEWLKHLVVAVVEYQFNDPDETRLTQTTDGIRNCVPTPVDPPVVASAMTVTIKELSSPTGQIVKTTPIPDHGATISSDTPVSGDLKDFAVSTISVIGHDPVQARR